MRVINRWIAALGVCLAGVGLAACGGGGSDSGLIIAQVPQAGKITKAALEHWMPVEATVVYQENPQTPVPKGVVPDPPKYTACITYTRAHPEQLVQTGPKPTALQLKQKCAKRNAEVKELALNTLIAWNWTIAYGVKLGVKVSDAEAKSWLKTVNGRTYPKPGEFANYLKYTGQTESDMLFRSKVQLFEIKLSKKRTELEKLPNGKSIAAKLQAGAPPGNTWKAMTTCHKGYIVSACSTYKGPNPPGVPN
jgi:foldase protein PrsA